MIKQRNKAPCRAINLVDIVKNQVLRRDLPVLRYITGGRSWTSSEAANHIGSSQLPKKVQLKVNVRKALTLGLSQLIQQRTSLFSRICRHPEIITNYPT